METNRTQELILLGEIKGIVQGLKDGQDQQSKRIDGLDSTVNKRIDGLEDTINTRVDGVQSAVKDMDTRLRTVEQKSAVIGAVSGGAMSIGVALIIEGMKQWLGRGGAGN